SLERHDQNLSSRRRLKDSRLPGSFSSTKKRGLLFRRPRLWPYFRSLSRRTMVRSDYRRAALAAAMPAKVRANTPPRATSVQLELEEDEPRRPASPVFGGVMPVPVRGAVITGAGMAGAATTGSAQFTVTWALTGGVEN